MKWNELSLFHKVNYVVGLLCALAYLILSILSLMDILTDTRTVAYILLSVFWLSLGVRDWKERRTSAIVSFVFAGFLILVGIAFLFK